MEWVDLGEGARYALEPSFLDQAAADRAMSALQAELSFTQGLVRIFGRDIPEPRLTAYYGEPGTNYRYSGHERRPLPFGPTLSELRTLVEERCAQPFNAVLANLYRDGRDSMGFHRDNEPELGPDPAIASVSLGATRIFILKQKGAPPIRIPLGHGSLLLMNGRVQARHHHGVPKTKQAVGPRINLTFRRVIHSTGSSSTEA